MGTRRGHYGLSTFNPSPQNRTVSTRYCLLSGEKVYCDSMLMETIWLPNSKTGKHARHSLEKRIPFGWIWFKVSVLCQVFETLSSRLIPVSASIKKLYGGRASSGLPAPGLPVLLGALQIAMSTKSVQVVSGLSGSPSLTITPIFAASSFVHLVLEVHVGLSSVHTTRYAGDKHCRLRKDLAIPRMRTNWKDHRP
jgi:hypothetical protein